MSTHTRPKWNFRFVGIDHATRRAMIAAALAGELQRVTRARLGIKCPAYSLALWPLGIMPEDLLALDGRERVRDCLEWRGPILSQHSGHRLCRTCVAERENEEAWK